MEGAHSRPPRDRRISSEKAGVGPASVYVPRVRGAGRRVSRPPNAYPRPVTANAPGPDPGSLRRWRELLPIQVAILILDLQLSKLSLGWTFAGPRRATLRRGGLSCAPPPRGAPRPPPP